MIPLRTFPGKDRHNNRYGPGQWRDLHRLGRLHDPAIYYAFDPDGAEETADLTWKLEGPDRSLAQQLSKARLEDRQAAAYRPRSPSSKAPDWEMPRGKERSSSNNNVYEVTLVVTDANKRSEGTSCP